MVESLFDLALTKVAENYLENPKDQPYIGKLIKHHKIVERVIEIIPCEEYERDYGYKEKLDIHYFCWKHLLPLVKSIEKDVYHYGFIGYGDEMFLVSELTYDLNI